jgi:hypothetical protein
MNFLSRLPSLAAKWARRLALTALILCAVFVAMAVFASLVNADLLARNSQEKLLFADKDGPVLADVRVVIHKLLADENAVEVSFVVSALRTDLPASLRYSDGCLTLLFGERSLPDRPTRKMLVSCRETASGFEASNVVLTESERINLHAFPSVAGYPFDKWTFLPRAQLYISPGEFARAQYRVQRDIPGKLLAISGDKYNWEISLERPPLEKILVLACGLAFVSLTTLVTLRLFASDALTGLQEVIAVAGYLVAAAGFRDLLGVSRAYGVSAFEIMVVGTPIVALSLGIATSMLRGNRTIA